MGIDHVSHPVFIVHDLGVGYITELLYRYSRNGYKSFWVQVLRTLLQDKMEYIFMYVYVNSAIQYLCHEW